MTLRRIVPTEGEMRKLAARLGRKAKPGDVICLAGPLGSGKTTFVQGFAKGAGYKGSVTSPTFGIDREYPTRRLRIHHLDLYRLEPKDLPNLGLEEYFEDPKGVCLVEWPELASRMLPSDRLEIRLAHLKDGGRSVVLKAWGPRSGGLLP